MEKDFKQAPFAGKRIVLFGPESTGKTTLAKQLANHYNVPYVAEFMRDYLQQKWDESKTTSTKKDVLPIAKGQLMLENKATNQHVPLIICDTNLLEISVYAKYYFDGFNPQVLEDAVENHQYDHYFLTYYDVPWEADDLRDRPNDRSRLFCIFEDALRSRNLSYTLLKGDISTRFEQAKKTIYNFYKL